MIDLALTSESILHSFTCIGDSSRANGHLGYSLRATLSNSGVQSLLTCTSRRKVGLNSLHGLFKIRLWETHFLFCYNIYYFEFIKAETKTDAYINTLISENFFVTGSQHLFLEFINRSTRNVWLDRKCSQSSIVQITLNIQFKIRNSSITK